MGDTERTITSPFIVLNCGTATCLLENQKVEIGLTTRLVVKSPANDQTFSGCFDCRNPLKENIVYLYLGQIPIGAVHLDRFRRSYAGCLYRFESNTDGPFESEERSVTPVEDGFFSY